MGLVEVASVALELLQALLGVEAVFRVELTVASGGADVHGVLCVGPA
jgi:hypothetical protein